MMDEGLLARALTRPAQDASARALDEMMHLAQCAEYEPAAVRAAELIDSGCKDVRAFVVYAVATFAERGPATIPELFAALTALLPPQSAVPPPRAADLALRFGFRTMRAHLDFDERRPEAARQAWSQHLVAGSADAVARACVALRQALQLAFNEPLCEAELGAVVARLETYCARRQPERVAPTQVVAAAAAPEPVSVVLNAPLAQPEPTFARRAADYDEAPERLAISPALRAFMRKLQAFEHLVANGSLSKAAIVAGDIRQVIAAFDPMLYLPGLLAPHFRLLSQHADELAACSEHAASPAAFALEQLYRVDLDAFLEA